VRGIQSRSHEKPVSFSATRTRRLFIGSRISIDAMVQKEPGEGESRVDIVLLTHRALEKNVDRATAKIEKLSSVLGKVTLIRLESLL